MNKVILIGRLTKNPELRTTNSGISSTKFTIAVNRRFKNDAGDYEADFITCTAWKQTAEFISRYFTKGQMIVAEGNLRTGSYQDKNHPDVTHYTTEVFVDNAEFCGSKSDNSGQSVITIGAGNTAQRAVQAANNAGVQTQFTNNFEEILSDCDTPF